MNRVLSSQLVRRLGNLDKFFAQENAEMLDHSSEFPHAVMMQYVSHLVRYFKTTDKNSDELKEQAFRLLDQTVNLLESALRENDPDMQSMIRVSFIEQVYDEDAWLFDRLVFQSGPLLLYEMLAHKTERIGFEIVTAIKHVYGNHPPANLSDMCRNPLFVDILASEGLSLTRDMLLDTWGNPYHFSTRYLPETRTHLLCVVSLASLRENGEDIESCLPV